MNLVNRIRGDRVVLISPAADRNPPGYIAQSITRHQAEYRYDGGLYLDSTAVLKT